MTSNRSSIIGTFVAELFQERSAKLRLLEQDKSEHARSMERAEHSERLRLEAETEVHRQNMEEMRLAKAAERSAKQRELEKLQDEHKRELSRELNRDNLEQVISFVLGLQLHFQKSLDSTNCLFFAWSKNCQMFLTKCSPSD